MLIWRAARLVPLSYRRIWLLGNEAYGGSMFACRHCVILFMPAGEKTLWINWNTKQIPSEIVFEGKWEF